MLVILSALFDYVMGVGLFSLADFKVDILIVFNLDYNFANLVSDDRLAAARHL